MPIEPGPHSLIRAGAWATHGGAPTGVGVSRLSLWRQADGVGSGMGGPGDTASLRPTWATLLDALARSTTAAQVTGTLNQLIAEHGLRWGAPQTDVEAPTSGPTAGIVADLSALAGVPATATAPAAPVAVAMAAVMQHVASVSLPVVWDTTGPRQAGVGEFHAAVSDYVARKRISLTLRTPGDGRWRVDFATDPVVLRDRGLALPLIVQTQLLATHLNEAVLARLASRRAEPQLSNAEVTVLRWTLAGRTTPEIGQTMGITSSQVSGHARAAVDELECAGKHHAAARALHQGWLLN